MSAKDQYTEQKYRKMIRLQKLGARIQPGTKELFALFDFEIRCFLNLICEVKKKAIKFQKKQRVPKKNYLQFV